MSHAVVRWVSKLLLIAACFAVLLALAITVKSWPVEIAALVVVVILGGTLILRID